MPEVTASPVAFQTTQHPTNKLARGTTVAAGIGGVIAATFATFGGDAVREVWAATMPASLQGPATVGFVVAALVAAATYLASKYGGQQAAFNVLDAPNVPLAMAAQPAPAPVPPA